MAWEEKCRCSPQSAVAAEAKRMSSVVVVSGRSVGERRKREKKRFVAYIFHYIIYLCSKWDFYTTGFPPARRHRRHRPIHHPLQARVWLSYATRSLIGQWAGGGSFVDRSFVVGGSASGFMYPRAPSGKKFENIAGVVVVSGYIQSRGLLCCVRRGEHRRAALVGFVCTRRLVRSLTHSVRSSVLFSSQLFFVSESCHSSGYSRRGNSIQE